MTTIDVTAHADDRVERARRAVADGARTLLRVGPVTLASIGLTVTLLTFVLPGIAHGAGLALGTMAVAAHMLASGWLLVAPARLVMRSAGRRLIVRWLGRVATLAVAGWAYPMVALPIVGVALPPLACAGLLFAHAKYLHWQLDRDVRKVPLHGLEIALLTVMTMVVGVGLVVAIMAAVGVGLVIDHWGLPSSSGFGRRFERHIPACVTRGRSAGAPTPGRARSAPPRSARRLQRDFTTPPAGSGGFYAGGGTGQHAAVA